jgi:chromosomal replication initiation ATPase DnaA
MNYVEKHPQLNDEFTFDTFVRYDDNENAYSLCFDITKNNGNP